MPTAFDRWLDAQRIERENHALRRHNDTRHQLAYLAGRITTERLTNVTQTSAPIYQGPAGFTGAAYTSSPYLDYYRSTGGWGTGTVSGVAVNRRGIINPLGGGIA